MCHCTPEGDRCNELWQLELRFAAVEDWLDEYLDSIDTLLMDHKMLVGASDDQPWTIQFAIDFHDIHDYVLPFSDLLRHYERLKDDHQFRRRITLDYLARVCIFRRLYDCGPPTLIAPYAKEFTHRFLTYVQSALRQDRLQDYVSRLWTDLETAVSAVGDAVGLSMEASDFVSHITDEDLLNLVVRSHPELVLVARAEGLGFVERIDEVLTTGLGLPSERNRLARIGYGVEEVSYWRSRLMQARPNRGATQTRRDAQALAMLERANEQARSEGERELNLLITGSRDVLKAVALAGEEKLVQLPSGEKTSLIRPLHLFLIYLRHAPDPEDVEAAARDKQAASRAALASLESANQEAEAFREVRDKTHNALNECPRKNKRLAGDEEGPFVCPLESISESLESTIRKVERLRDELEDSQLILRSNPDFEAFAERILATEEPGRFERTIVQIVRRLLEDESLKRTIAIHIGVLRNRIVRGIVGLSAQVGACTSVLQEANVAFLLEMPFGIKFASESLRSALEEAVAALEEAAGRKDTPSIEEVLARLMTRVLRCEAIDFEKELIEILILLAFSQNHLANRLAEACLTFDLGELRREFLYLQIRALVRFDWEAGEEICGSALSDYAQDSRFHFLAGHFDWRRYSETKNKKDLDNAIAKTRAGLRCHEAQDRQFWDMKNNEAYFLAERGRIREAIEIARKIEEEAHIPAARATWHETLSFVFRRGAESSHFSVPERLTLVEESKAALKRSLDGYLTPAERDRASQAMSELGELRKRLQRETDPG